MDIASENVKFLWDFFIELKDDGLNVDIGYVTQVGRRPKDDIKDIWVKISDPLEICGHVYVSLEHKKQVADILKRLSSIGHAPTYVYWSEYDKELQLRFKIQN